MDNLLTLQDLHTQNLILLETISGSHAYGLATAQSDVDIKGVFYLPPEHYFGLHYTPQIANETNDIVYYELGRWIQLLLASNPHALELLYAPEDCIRKRHDILNILQKEWFISLSCQHSFATYAIGQVRKARGLNKKMVNPMNKEKKTVLDFCYIIQGNQSISLITWLAQNGWTQEKIGLSSIAHARDLFGVFYDANGSLGYSGIMQKNAANNLLLSKIQGDEEPIAYLSFNQDGYSSYCREYASYWQWVRERNPSRYENNQAHQGGYDSKNMMHTFRLLQTAKHIAQTGQLRVRCDNRDELLAIKNGQYPYEYLLDQAEQLIQEIETLFAENPCHLPKQVQQQAAEQALITMRQQLYVCAN